MSEARHEIQQAMGTLVGALFDYTAELETANEQVAKEAVGVVQEILDRLDKLEAWRDLAIRLLDTLPERAETIGKLEAWHERVGQLVEELPQRIGSEVTARKQGEEKISELFGSLTMRLDWDVRQEELLILGLELELSNPMEF